MLRLRATTALFLCAAMSECVAAGARGAGPANRAVVVPLGSLRTRHLTVSVRVNGAGPFRLVFDTGSPITFINGSAARKAGLISAVDAKRPALMGMRGEAKSKSFRVGSDDKGGGATVRDFPLIILDHPLLGLLSQFEGPIDGIVGFTFFARFRTTIDYAALQLTLAPIDYSPADVMVDMVARVMGNRPAQTLVAPGGLWGMILENSNEGVRVSQVYTGSSAETGGLRAGDRLVTLDGRWVITLADCYEAAQQAGAGHIVLVRVGRDGKEMELKVTPRLGL